MTKSRLISIDTCEDCPFINRDDSSDERKWGKVWCDKMDRELVFDKLPIEIPNECPLPIAKQKN